LTDVQRIDGDDAAAIGIDLRTMDGRRLRLWWSPEEGEGSSFADGTTLNDALAVDLDGQRWSTAPAMTGHITGLDRQAGWIDVAGFDDIEPGERLIVNPDGRARNYAVIRRQAVAGAQRLWLDVTSQLGRGRILTCDGGNLRLRYTLFTRTGYLHGARLCAADNDTTALASGVEIINAWNPDPHHTEIQLRQPLAAASAGDWVWAVDYIVGDSVQWEAVRNT